VGIAFSMGGNILLNYVAEHHDMVGAMSICQGYDGLAAVQHIESERPFFRRVLLHKQKAYLREHSAVLGNRINVDRALAADNLFDLERHFTCALQVRQENGEHSSPEQYFDSASCVHRVHRVPSHVPLLLLNALDDPLVPPRLAELAVALSAAHPNIIAAQTTHGGHLGFMMSDSAWLPSARSFADVVALEFIHTVLLLQSRRQSQ
jgi:abhydrolase domain-containing protein 2